MSHRSYLRVGFAVMALCITLAVLAGGALSATQNSNKLYFKCPHLVKVGPTNLPAGWDAIGGESLNFAEAGVLTPEGPIVCTYGRTDGKQHSIMRLAPEKYTCRAENPRNRDVVCTPKLKAPIKIK